MTKNLLSLIKPQRFEDHRGFFAETYNRKKYSEFGIDLEFVQDNHSISNEEGTIRGLHFQAPPNAQAKIVRCGRGAIFDVAVDLRRGSPTYGKWEAYELSAENGCQLYIPVGFAHGFLTLEPHSEIVYKCSDFFASESERCVLWSDPCIGIDWPTVSSPILSIKDAAALPLADIESPFLFGVNS